MFFPSLFLSRWPILLVGLFSGVSLGGCDAMRHIYLGTDDGFHQKAGINATAVSFGLGSDTLSSDVFGGGGNSNNGGSGSDADTVIKLQRTRAIGVSLTHETALSPRVALTGKIYAGVGQTRFFLPQGVLLAGGRTRLSDPITVDFLSLRVVPQVTVWLAVGPIEKPWLHQGIGAGIAAAQVKTKINSALLDVQGTAQVTDPFIASITKIGNTSLEIRQYKKFGATGSLGWQRDF